MRHTPTPAEAVIWGLIRDRRLAGFKFRRQFPIGRFIVDFVCLERKLIIEIDGEIHQTRKSEDAVRQEYLEGEGFRVIRFENAEVLNNLKNVQDHIAQALAKPT